MDDVEKQVILQAVRELENLYQDSVKYPQLRIPDHSLRRLGRTLKLLEPLCPRRSW